MLLIAGAKGQLGRLIVEEVLRREPEVRHWRPSAPASRSRSGRSTMPRLRHDSPSRASRPQSKEAQA
jgi:hypothetical protein